MKKRVFSLIIGILLLAGCAAYVASLLLDFKPAEAFAGWWTVFLIVPGLMGLFNKGTRLGGFGLSLFGLGLLAREQDAVNGLLGGMVKGIGVWQMVLAIVLLLAGLAIVGSAFRRKKTPAIECGCDNNGNRGIHISDTDDVTNVMSSEKVDYTGQVFAGREFSNVFGDLTVDLRGAVIEKDCELEVDSVFGKLTVYIGDQANYRISSTQVLGNVTGTDSIISDDLPTVTIEANAVFGEVVISR